MSAGTGIFHSEFNDSGEEQLDFLQIWVFPREENTAPHYKSYDIRPVLKKNELGVMIAPDAPPRLPSTGCLVLDGYVGCGTGEGIQTAWQEERRLPVVIEGEVEVANTVLSKRDGAGFWDTDSIAIEVLKHATVLLMEVPME